MSTLELQTQLISKIQATTDDDILEGVLSLLEFETEQDDVYILSEAQKLAIAKAKKQIENGEFYTDEEADKLTEEWLKE